MVARNTAIGRIGTPCFLTLAIRLPPLTSMSIIAMNTIPICDMDWVAGDTLRRDRGKWGGVGGARLPARGGGGRGKNAARPPGRFSSHEKCVKESSGFPPTQPWTGTRPPLHRSAFPCPYAGMARLFPNPMCGAHKHDHFYDQPPYPPDHQNCKQSLFKR